MIKFSANWQRSTPSCRGTAGSPTCGCPQPQRPMVLCCPLLARLPPMTNHLPPGPLQAWWRFAATGTRAGAVLPIAGIGMPASCARRLAMLPGVAPSLARANNQIVRASSKPQRGHPSGPAPMDTATRKRSSQHSITHM